MQLLMCIRHSDISVSVLQSPRNSYPIYNTDGIHVSLGLNMNFLFSDAPPSLDGVGL